MTERESSMTPIALFDFGGVLAEEGFVEGLTAIAGMNGYGHVTRFVELGHDIIHETGYVIGKGSEKEYWNAMRAQTGISQDDGVLRNEIMSRFHLRSWMLGAVRDIKTDGYGVGILSDQTNWLDELNESFQFFPLFDRVFNSYHMGTSKKDPAHFDSVISTLQLPPGNIIFVDDNAGHCERARSRGIRTVHYKDQSAVNEVRALLPPAKGI